MSLPHILLGLLAEPASGYDVKQVFDQTLRHFWRAELSQIYPTLKRLRDEGLLSSEPRSSSQGPDRVVYERTEEGRQELLQWLSGPPDLSAPRLSYLAQLFYLGELGDLDRTSDFLRALRTGFSRQLQALLAMEEHWFTDPDNLPDDMFHGLLTLRFGIVRSRATLDWCEEALTLVARRSSSRPAPDHRTEETS